MAHTRCGMSNAVAVALLRYRAFIRGSEQVTALAGSAPGLQGGEDGSVHMA